MTFSIIIAEVAVDNLIRNLLSDDPPDFKVAPRYLKVFTSSRIIPSMKMFVFLSLMYHRFALLLDYLHFVGF